VAGALNSSGLGYPGLLPGFLACPFTRVSSFWVMLLPCRNSCFSFVHHIASVYQMWHRLTRSYIPHYRIQQIVNLVMFLVAGWSFGAVRGLGIQCARNLAAPANLASLQASELLSAVILSPMVVLTQNDLRDNCSVSWRNVVGCSITLLASTVRQRGWTEPVYIWYCLIHSLRV